jgi:P pilus assembly chaperone PapD
LHLQIAQENHEALLAQDEADDTKQKKNEQPMRPLPPLLQVQPILTPLWKARTGKAEVAAV